ncbi:MAG: molybdenum cofactor guanylyltransferase [Pseudonocardiales bacterium]|nr:MAG: molybdenum cofactor guanylyltransferase [Pseudonocardiales bacterium]
MHSARPSSPRRTDRPASAVPERTGSPAYDAVLLAGGAARRLGGADKPGLDVGGRSLAARVAAAASGAGRLILVGPPRADVAADVVTREVPPGGGPALALAAGLRHVEADYVAVLAADLPFLTPAVIDVLRAAAGDADAAVLVDDAGHDQLLCSVWQTRAARAATGDVSAGTSMRSVYARAGAVARVVVETGGPPPWWDCDTEDDLRDARRAVSPPKRAGEDAMTTLEDWTARICTELGIADGVDLSILTRPVLDLVRDVAHGVDRPAAPLTAYLIGVAAGRAGDATTATPDLLAIVGRLVQAWEPADETADES